MFYSKSTGGFYDDAIRAAYVAAGTWPADAVEITDAEHAALLTAQSTDSIIQADSSGNPVKVVRPPLSVSVLQQDACSQIDQAAGATRGKYITVTGGQDAVYQLKYDEATAYQSTSNPVASNFPHLNAEATQTNTPIATVAQNVVNTRNQWVQLSAKIEGYRLGGKQAVNAATDATGVQTALNTALANLGSC